MKETKGFLCGDNLDSDDFFEEEFEQRRREQEWREKILAATGTKPQPGDRWIIIYCPCEQHCVFGRILGMERGQVTLISAKNGASYPIQYVTLRPKYNVAINFAHGDVTENLHSFNEQCQQSPDRCYNLLRYFYSGARIGKISGLPRQEVKEKFAVLAQNVAKIFNLQCGQVEELEPGKALIELNRFSRQPIIKERVLEAIGQSLTAEHFALVVTFS